MIGTKYQLVGTALLNDTTGVIIDSIKGSSHFQVEDINVEILKRWIQERGRDRSWRELIRVLRSSSCEALADDVEEVMGASP